MKRGSFLVLIAVVIGCATCANAQTPDVKGKVCHMEQQCHWENFKKTCTWVKVCR
jgi:hypothetical protein